MMMMMIMIMMMMMIIIIIIIKAKEEEKNKKVTKFWTQKVKNDRIIPSNKPDIIIRDNVKGTCLIIDNAISGDRNVMEKEAERF